MGRRSILAVVAAVAILSAGLGWVLGQRIKSPAEAAAEKAAPEPSLITVPTEMRELSSRVVVRGTVVSSGSTAIGVSGSTLGASLLTRLPLGEGDPLEEGDVALEVAGRPVLVLQGDLPEFRSLAPGMEGPDVRQLELALARLGYNPGTIDDTYSVSTGEAVADLYEDAGYSANEPSREEKGQLDLAEESVSEAKKALAAAGGTSSSGLPESQRLQLDQSITQAKEQLADAKSSRESELAALQSEKDRAAGENTTAQEASQKATSRLDAAKAGTHPDTGQPPTDEELAALADEASSTKEIADAAAAAAAEANSAYDQGKVNLDRAIRDAEVQVQIAEASKKEATDGAVDGGSDLGQESTADLKKRVTDAEDELASLRASIGVTLPAAEFRFVKTLPSVVQSVQAELGETPAGTVMTISGASTLIESSVSEADWKLIETGMTGLAEDEDLGVSVEVTITELASSAGGSDTSADRYAMQLTPNGDVPDEAMFQSLRVTLPISSTGGEVLAVPLAAVSAAADGTSRVEVDNGDGETKLVGVTTGLAADGYVEIRPTDGSLDEGDRVVVGRDLLLPDATGGGSESESEDVEADEEDAEAKGSG